MALLAKVWLQHVFLRYTRHLHKGCATNLPVGLAPSRIAAFAGAALTLFLLGAAVFATLKPERSGGGLPSRHLGNDVTIEFSSNLTGTSLSTPGSPENAVLAAAAATLDTPLDGGSNATAIDGQALVTIPLSPACKVGCGYELLSVPWEAPVEGAPPLPPHCSEAPRTVPALTVALSSSTPSGGPPRGSVLWVAFVGDSILKAEFKELAAAWLGKAAPETAGGGGRVSLARFAEERHNCVKGGEASCFIAGSREMYYYVPRIICCAVGAVPAKRRGKAQAVRPNSCGLYRLMPEEYGKVPDIIQSHTTGTAAARARSHVCASFVFMRKPADVVEAVSPLVAPGRQGPYPTAVVINPVLHPMAPVLRYSPEKFRDETANMYSWLLGVQREQAAAIAAAAAGVAAAATTGREAVAAAPAWPTLFLQQVGTPIQDTRVNPKHVAWMNSPRVIAFNAQLREEWADYASRAVAEGILPARLLDSHSLAWTLLRRGSTTTHDGVHLSSEFSRAQASVVVNAMLEGVAAQRQQAAGACGGSAWAVESVDRPAVTVPAMADASAPLNGTAAAAPPAASA